MYYKWGENASFLNGNRAGASVVESPHHHKIYNWMNTELPYDCLNDRLTAYLKEWTNYLT